jgi:uncharacterized protein YndB with AHSA1/START domain
MTGGSRRGREVRITRVFQASREVVFGAWIDPDQVTAWFAPEACEVPRESVEIDARPGGRIHFTMVETGGGAVYPVRFEIVEISAPELLVLTSEPDPEIGVPNRMLTRVVFEVQGDETRVTITQGPHTDEMECPADIGWRESLDKLERVLGARPAPS